MRRILVIVIAVLCSISAAVIAGGQAPSATATAAGGTIGLDHIPIAVANLEQAADRYKALGFALKPGRPHGNGIRNQHVKFTDGTELELITAPEARDALTNKYRRHIAAGDGPAFLALYAPGRTRPADNAVPDYIFFGPRNSSPTDRPEHFAHPNGAESLIAVWLAGDDLTGERQLLTGMGARMSDEDVRVPDALKTPVARLSAGAVVLLPGRRQLVPGRPIVGATLRVKSVAAAQAVIAAGPAGALTVVSGRGYSSIFLPPDQTHGLWLELRELR
jgi:catechol 2,3-dioxygenase-like lactoylglutathione lyase family enzyme